MAENCRPLSARAAAPLRGTAAVPGDKSISHRALILGALTVGETRISGLLEAEDVLSTAEAMRRFGAEVRRGGGGARGGWGRGGGGGGGCGGVGGGGGGGLGGLSEPLYFGIPGTGPRLSMGAMATTPIRA